MGWDEALLGTSVVGTGLVAGLFYGWSTSVIPGTRGLGSASYVEAMQLINRAILNPAFLVPFLGVPVVLGAAAVTGFRAGEGARGWLLVGATATYAVGLLGVTVARNVPMNEALDRFVLLGASPEDVELRRRAFEASWNRWHQVRMVAGVASFVLATAAALVGRGA